MKKIKILKTLLIPTIGITAIGTITAVSTSCSPVVIVTGVSLDKESLALEVGDSDTLTATVLPESATDKSVTWISSNSSVATVDNNGKVTAVSPGSAKITVKTNNGGYEDYCDVTVTYTAASYICITANADSTLELINNEGNNPNLQYSFNGQKWTTYSEALNIPVDKKIYLIGNNHEGWSLSRVKYSHFNITGNVSISGNVMSLLDNGTGTISSIPNDYCFYDLFDGSKGITGVSEDFLPAITLAENCYHGMFADCTSLTTAPELPATDLATSCYNFMFANCSYLTIAPDLPATGLTKNCYSSMFVNCTSLTTTPDLPATNLIEYCYDSMFYGCTSLTTAPALPATTLANNCYSYMFYGCTSLTTVPDLPATTLSTYCYDNMFVGCSNLALVRIGYVGTKDGAPDGAFDYWVFNVAATGTFYYKGSDTLENFGFPSGWTINPN